jgi:broad specificity phosphatase PhoE
MAKLFVFRTGSVRTKENVFLGWLNKPLNESGLKEAKKVSNKLKKESIQYAFCSDQFRGKEALLEIVKSRRKTKIIIDSRLRERNYGIFSGHSKELFKKLFPDKYKEIHRKYEAQVPLGENMVDVSKRVFSFMNDLMKFMREENANIVICAHTNSMRLIREYLEDLEKEHVSELEHSPEEYKEYTIFFEY